MKLCRFCILETEKFSQFFFFLFSLKIIFSFAFTELYYEGEGLEQQQAFTCPFCGKMGFTESALHEHVTADHTVSTFEVVSTYTSNYL